MKKIVITGTIGSGKSYVSNILKTVYHLPVLDVDVVARDVRNHQAKDDIIKHFGEDIIVDGEINSKKLSSIVFQDNQKLKKLESLIHPIVYKEMLAFFDCYNDSPLVIVEHPLVYELGWEQEFDEVWLVTCDSQIALERLVNYRGYSREEAMLILDKQETNKSKAKKANRIIYNDNHTSVVKQLDNILKEENVC